MPSLNNETSWLISKGMCVLLFDVLQWCFLVPLKKWIGVPNVYY